MGAQIINSEFIGNSKNVTKFNEKLGFYPNGIDNNYGEYAEYTINRSHTAKSCTRFFSKFIKGRGFEPINGKDPNKIIVNRDKQTTLKRFSSDVVDSYCMHKGVFTQIGYDLNCDIDSLRVLPYNHCRLGKVDDNENISKIGVCDNWKDFSSNKKDTVRLIDSYNPIKEVIRAQIDHAGGIENYKGQILFFNPENTIYPLCHLDGVLIDAENERVIAEYKNDSLHNGFFGKTILITPPMPESQPNYQSGGSSGSLPIQDFLRQKQSENGFKDVIKKFMGAKNANGLLLIVAEFEGDDINKVIKFIKIQSDVDDRMFEYTESTSRRNIMAGLQIPVGLIRQEDLNAFANSGSLLKEAKLIFQETVEDDISALSSNIFNELLPKFKEFKNEGFDEFITIPLIEIGTPWQAS